MLRSSSICISFLYNYLTSDSNCTDENGNVLDKKCQKLRCLSDTLQSYGGILSKISQLLSLNDQNNSVFSDCKPFSKDKTILFFKDFVKNTDLELESVDFNVHKSGSVGQIHKCEYKGQKVIFKVQYVGLAEQTLKDIKLLDKIVSYLYHFSDMKEAMVDIKTKMYEELDYKLEANNQQLLYKLYSDNEEIKIPKIIPELCSEQILGMEYVKGKSLRDFIEDSTQEERNKIGMSIVKFIFESIYKHNIFYSDVHYGNFLITDECRLCVLDFGCIHSLDNVLIENIYNLHRSLIDDDKELFYSIVKKMGIINSDISVESKNYIFNYFKLQYEPWISEEFEFTEEWLDIATDKDTELMKEWTLPQNMVFFNKIPYGSYHIFTKLKLKGKFKEVFEKIFENFN
jgi:predicted unusual protein kinase regulating ubiquinone biosynthesis (AarF/ABC1/UbiB family)